MKCPLTLKANFYVQSGIEVVGMDCLKEECAWWDNTNSICAVLQLSKSIYYAGIHIAQMEIKMPHEEQFRR